jgi:hypothetical protein
MSMPGGVRGGNREEPSYSICEPLEAAVGEPLKRPRCLPTNIEQFFLHSRATRAEAAPISPHQPQVWSSIVGILLRPHVHACAPTCVRLKLSHSPHRAAPFVCLAAHETGVSRWTTAVNVKLLLAPRQSRGTSHGGLVGGSWASMRSFFASPRRASRPASSTPATGRSAGAAGGIGPAEPATGGPSRAHDRTDENARCGGGSHVVKDLRRVTSPHHLSATLGRDPLTARRAARAQQRRRLRSFFASPRRERRSDEGASDCLCLKPCNVGEPRSGHVSMSRPVKPGRLGNDESDQG